MTSAYPTYAHQPSDLPPGEHPTPSRPPSATLEAVATLASGDDPRRDLAARLLTEHNEAIVAPSPDDLRGQLAAVTAERDALHCVLRHALLSHPLPWQVEQDWTWEVIAADGAIVAKCQTPAEAQAIVSLAERAASTMAEANEYEVPA